MAAGKTPKFTFPQLALLDWLMEEGTLRFYSTWSSGGGSGSMHLFETSGKGEDGRWIVRRIYPLDSKSDVEMLRRLGGREHVDTLSMFRAGFFNTYNTNHTEKEAWKKFADRFGRNWHWSETVHLPTDKARAYWNSQGKELFAAMKAKRDLEQAAAERLVIVGRMLRVAPVLPPEIASRVPRGMALPLPSREVLRPQALCRVVKETDLRLYVTDVQTLVPVDYGARVVTGREPNLFVDRRHVIADNADAALARRLQAIDAEHVEDIGRIAAHAVEEMLPILLNLEARLKQKDAERAALFGEALDEREPKGHPGP